MESDSGAMAWGGATASLLLVPWAGPPSIPDMDTIGTWGALSGECMDGSKAGAGTTGSAGACAGFSGTGRNSSNGCICG